MNKIYCLSCFQPTFYAAIKPQFCGFCSKSFDSSAQASINDPQPAKPVQKPTFQTPSKPSYTPKVYNPDDDETEVDERSAELPQINGLDVEISVAKHQGIKLKDLVAEHKLGIEPRRVQKISKKKFQEDWQREAGTRRRDEPPIEIGGGE